MEHGAEGLSGLHQVMIFLVVAGVGVPILARLGLNPVLGYLILGILLGPHGLAAWFPGGLFEFLKMEDDQDVRLLSELGVMFLLFMIGLELSFERLRALRRLIVGLGSLQIIVTAAVIGAIAALWGNTLAAAMVLGLAFALSSTAIVMQLLVDRRQLTTTVGRHAFAILLAQDMAVVPILFVIGALSSAGDGNVLIALVSALATAAAAIVAIALVGKAVMQRLYRWTGATRNRELFVALTLLLILGLSTATAAAGLSPALGAFLCGLLIAETEFRHQVEGDIEPFKGLLLGVFFLSVGMRLDPVAAFAQGHLVVLAVPALLLVKAAILFGLARAFGLSRGQAVETAILLSQGGEFAFVIVNLATNGEILPPEIAQFMLLVVTLSMILTPGLALLGSRVGARLAGGDAAKDAVPHAPDGQVIIAGFGRVGQTLARILKDENIPYIAVDANADVVAKAREKKEPVYYGDAGAPDMLARLGAPKARAIVLTTAAGDVVEHMAAEVRRQWPEIALFARARDTEQGAMLLRIGASDVFPETVDASLGLAARVLASIGLPDEAINRRLDDERARTREAMASAPDRKGAQ